MRPIHWPEWLFFACWITPCVLVGVLKSLWWFASIPFFLVLWFAVIFLYCYLRDWRRRAREGQALVGAKEGGLVP